MAKMQQAQQTTPSLTFEQAMKIIATTPKEVVDERIKQAKKIIKPQKKV